MAGLVREAHQRVLVLEARLEEAKEALERTLAKARTHDEFTVASVSARLRLAREFLTERDFATPRDVHAHLTQKLGQRAGIAKNTTDLLRRNTDDFAHLKHGRYALRASDEEGDE